MFPRVTLIWSGSLQMERVWQAWQAMDFWKLLTILTAAFVAYVAYQQYRLGREKLKLDLFEKRFAVFAGTRLLLTHVLRNANVTLEQLFEYRASIGQASFLFDDDITGYLTSIDEKALELLTGIETMKPYPSERKDRRRRARSRRQRNGYWTNCRNSRRDLDRT